MTEYEYDENLDQAYNYEVGYLEGLTEVLRLLKSNRSNDLPLIGVMEERVAAQLETVKDVARPQCGEEEWEYPLRLQCGEEE
ncbi:hypothetical protein N9X64_00600 [bacterium]|nr:hypothetical protein [bacterium]